MGDDGGGPTVLGQRPVSLKGSRPALANPIRLL